MAGYFSFTLRKIVSITQGERFREVPSQKSANIHSQEIREAIKSWPNSPKHSNQKLCNTVVNRPMYPKETERIITHRRC